MSEDQPDTQFKSHIICPYCGQNHYSNEVTFEDVTKIMNCKKCSKEFKAIKIEMVEYSTYKTACF